MHIKVAVLKSNNTKHWQKCEIATTLTHSSQKSKYTTTTSEKSDITYTNPTNQETLLLSIYPREIKTHIQRFVHE